MNRALLLTEPNGGRTIIQPLKPGDYSRECIITADMFEGPPFVEDV